MNSQVLVTDTFDHKRHCYSNSNLNDVYCESSTFCEQRYTEGKYIDPISSSYNSQRPPQVVDPQQDESANYSSSLFSDSIIQAYDDGTNESSQHVPSSAYNPALSFPEPCQSYDYNQADYIVYELSPPVDLNISASKYVDHVNGLAVHRDIAFPNSEQPCYPVSQGVTTLNNIPSNRNCSVYQAPYSSLQSDNTHNYTSVHVVPPSDSCGTMYNSATVDGLRYDTGSQINCRSIGSSQQPFQSFGEHFAHHRENQLSYGYPAYSPNQTLLSTSYSQPVCFFTEQDTHSSHYPEPQEIYPDYQSNIYQGTYYTVPYERPVQHIWQEQLCSTQQPQWTSQSNSFGFKESYDQVQIYSSNRPYSYEQYQHHAFDFAENAQNDAQGLQSMSKTVQTFEKPDVTTEVPDVALQETGQEQGIGGQEINEEDDSAPSPSQTGAPCEPTHEYACSQCNRRFDRPSHLEIHFRTHTGERPFRCSICSKAFSQVSNLQRHMKSHKTWPQLRSLTDNTLSSTNFLVKPPRSIMSVARRVQVLSTSAILNYSFVDNQFECKFCGLRVRGFQNMRSHMVKHNNEKVYQCIVSSCLKTFTELEAFTEHLNKAHDLTDSKWLRCSKCNKQFENVSDLLGHYATKRGATSHRSSPKLSAKIGRKYTHSQEQMRRIQSNQLRCPLCRHKRFSRYGLLRIHLLNDHAVTSVSEASTLKSLKIKEIGKPTSSAISQDTIILSSTSDSTRSLADCGGSNTSVETPLRLTNVHLVIDRCVDGGSGAVKRRAKQGSVVSSPNAIPLECPLCKRVFKKRKFFEDHCNLCQQKQTEMERRQRWRDSRRQPGPTTAADSGSTVSTSGPPSMTSRRLRRSPHVVKVPPSRNRIISAS